MNPPGDDQPTLGELGRTIGQLRIDLHTDLSELRADIGALRGEVTTKSDLANTERAWQLRISAIESQMLDRVRELEAADSRNHARLDRIEKWAGILALMIVGPVVAALVGLVLVTGNGVR